MSEEKKKKSTKKAAVKPVVLSRPPHGGKWKRDPDTLELILVVENGQEEKPAKQEG